MCSSIVIFKCECKSNFIYIVTFKNQEASINLLFVAIFSLSPVGNFIQSFLRWSKIKFVISLMLSNKEAWHFYMFILWLNSLLWRRNLEQHTIYFVETAIMPLHYFLFFKSSLDSLKLLKISASSISYKNSYFTVIAFRFFPSLFTSYVYIIWAGIYVKRNKILFKTSLTSLFLNIN